LVALRKNVILRSPRSGHLEGRREVTELQASLTKKIFLAGKVGVIDRSATPPATRIPEDKP
jgi:hypothetical protein